MLLSRPFAVSSINFRRCFHKNCVHQHNGWFLLKDSTIGLSEDLIEPKPLEKLLTVHIFQKERILIWCVLKPYSFLFCFFTLVVVENTQIRFRSWIWYWLEQGRMSPSACSCHAMALMQLVGKGFDRNIRLRIHCVWFCIFACVFASVCVCVCVRRLCPFVFSVCLSRSKALRSEKD